jgi:hypothetical protein
VLPESHQGGHIEDTAAKGITFPANAGMQRLGCFAVQFNARSICRLSQLLCHSLNYPQVPYPRPDQINVPANQAHANPAHAADKAFDIPRSVNDHGQAGEILTGTSDQVSSNVEKRNLDGVALDPKANGYVRYAKHARQDNLVSSLKKRCCKP